MTTPNFVLPKNSVHLNANDKSVKLQFSFIIPVYNRPDELDELLKSLGEQCDTNFEVIVVEDGSENEAFEVVQKYQEELEIVYFRKENTGAGLSRNFGMQKAKGNYYIVLDSDCLLPPEYLKDVRLALENKYTPAFGGADAAHPSFNVLQKAINYSMTSHLTTGGIRGKKKAVGKFQPRSFNFGISKEAFEKTGGFGDMKIGEDIDLTLRLWDAGFETQFIERGYVFHKRRATLMKFFQQTYAFGRARPFLNRKFPDTKKLTYWFPSVFLILFLLSILGLLYEFPWFSGTIAIYLVTVLLDATFRNKSILVGVLSVITTCTQFFGYGLGFLKGYFL